jgi:hypothetical protein
MASQYVMLSLLLSPHHMSRWMHGRMFSYRELSFQLMLYTRGLPLHRQVKQMLDALMLWFLPRLFSNNTNDINDNDDNNTNIIMLPKYNLML